MSKATDAFSALANTIVETITARVVELQSETALPDMLSAKTIANRLDCSEAEVRKNIQEGRIPIVSFGTRGYRVPREEYMKRLIRWREGGEFWDQ